MTRTPKLLLAALFSVSLAAAGCDNDENNTPVTTNDKTTTGGNQPAGVRDNAGNNAVTSDRNLDNNVDKSGQSPLINPNDRPLANNNLPADNDGAQLDAATFVREASSGGLFEVESSKLALQKSLTDQGKEFANMMVEDHQKADMQLKELAGRKNLTVDGQMLPKHQAILDELKKIDGPDFQKRYHDAQVQAHQEAISLFDRASKDLTDPDLKQFASQTLPTLQKHRDHLSQHNHNTVDQK